jgi:acyl carrier protein
MNRADIFAKLQETFDEVFLDPVVVTPELTASKVPEWDSLLHITLVVAVEAKLGVRFRVGEVEGTNNVGELVDLIERRLTAP